MHDNNKEKAIGLICSNCHHYDKRYNQCLYCKYHWVQQFFWLDESYGVWSCEAYKPIDESKPRRYGIEEEKPETVQEEYRSSGYYKYMDMCAELGWNGY